jgi:hypothetical protein
MAYIVDPARMALVEDIVRLHAEFGALLDRISDAVDPEKIIMDPCDRARGGLDHLRDVALGIALQGAAQRQMAGSAFEPGMIVQVHRPGPFPAASHVGTD